MEETIQWKNQGCLLNTNSRLIREELDRRLGEYFNNRQPIARPECEHAALGVYPSHSVS